LKIDYVEGQRNIKERGWWWCNWITARVWYMEKDTFLAAGDYTSFQDSDMAKWNGDRVCCTHLYQHSLMLIHLPLLPVY